MRSRAALVGVVAWMLLGAASAFAQGQAVALPNGVQAVWDMDKAYHETTPTRERVCINGLWRWQPAEAGCHRRALRRMGLLQGPRKLAGHHRLHGEGLPDGLRQPRLEERGACGTLKAAWYERTFTVPADWTGRRVTLTADYLNSYAAVYIDGKQVGEMRFPAGEVDLTVRLQAGRDAHAQHAGRRHAAQGRHALLQRHERAQGSAGLGGPARPLRGRLPGRRAGRRRASTT